MVISRVEALHRSLGSASSRPGAPTLRMWKLMRVAMGLMICPSQSHTVVMDPIAGVMYVKTGAPMAGLEPCVPTTSGLITALPCSTLGQPYQDLLRLHLHESQVVEGDFNSLRGMGYSTFWDQVDYELEDFIDNSQSQDPWMQDERLFEMLCTVRETMPGADLAILHVEGKTYVRSSDLQLLVNAGTLYPGLALGTRSGQANGMFALKGWGRLDEPVVGTASLKGLATAAFGGVV